MNWLPRITELSRQVENGETGGFSAMQQLVAEVEAAATEYAVSLQSALIHLHDTSDYDPEVCPDCAKAQVLIDAIYAKRVKAALKTESEIGNHNGARSVRDGASEGSAGVVQTDAGATKGQPSRGNATEASDQAAGRSAADCAERQPEDVRPAGVISGRPANSVLAVGQSREDLLAEVLREMLDAYENGATGTVRQGLAMRATSALAYRGHSQGLPHAEQRYRDGLDEALGAVYAASTVDEASTGIRGLMAAHGRSFPAQGTKNA